MALLTKDGNVVTREKASIAIAFDPADLIRPFDEQVVEILESALILAEGNHRKAALRLGLKRTTFHAKLARHRGEVLRP